MTQQLISFLDTATLPNEEMLDAMRGAELGDDVYGQDPTMPRLEAMTAELLGKEAAVFVPSGTMANVIALRVHCRSGDEVVTEAESHIVWAEAGGLAAIAGCMPLLVEGERGVLEAELVEAALRPNDQHHPRTRLVCVENTHNRAGGTVTGPESMAALRELCDERGLVLHVDGARLFNASVALGIPAADLARDADSVTIALSKGLGAPVGSVLAGSEEFVADARRARKLLGGAMRQVGGLAAAGIVALTDGLARLGEDHERAAEIAWCLDALPIVVVDPGAVETNILHVDATPMGIGGRELANGLMERGIHVSPRPTDSIRLVTHRGIGDAEVQRLIEALEEIAAERS